MGKYTHLSITDRRRLHIFLEMKLSITEISKRLSRHRSTIYREIERNQVEDAYSHGIAHQSSTQNLSSHRSRQPRPQGSNLFRVDSIE